MSWAKKAATPRRNGKPLPAGKRHWDEEVAERLAAKEAKIAAGEYKPLENQCESMTTGAYGPVRRCEQACVKGMRVCWMHIKGSRKAALAKANKRLLAELDPTLSRLVELRDQNEDLKVALGASLKLKDAVMADEKKDSGKPIRKLVVGFAIGALPAGVAALGQASVDLRTEGGDDIEGEIVEDDSENDE